MNKMLISKDWEMTVSRNSGPQFIGYYKSLQIVSQGTLLRTHRILGD